MSERNNAEDSNEHKRAMMRIHMYQRKLQKGNFQRALLEFPISEKENVLKWMEKINRL